MSVFLILRHIPGGERLILIYVHYGGSVVAEEENYPKSRKRVSLTVNGTPFERDIDSRMTLAEFLREELGLTGTKVGCNRGECGGCTVILNGVPVYSCSILAVEATGGGVLTIEGLAKGGTLHPIQEAFIEHDSLQCGYCTPGMIMSVKALLDRNSLPTEEDIREAIDGNFCRCGSYPNIVKATMDAAERLASKERS
jgi:aerobic-type carbon monoxide dehydrogenase small subunit (CoxS/CutS family)